MNMEPDEVRSFAIQIINGRARATKEQITSIIDTLRVIDLLEVYVELTSWRPTYPYGGGGYKPTSDEQFDWFDE